MKVSYAKNKVRNRRGVAHSSHFQIAVNGVHAHLAFEVARLNSECVRPKFPKVKAKPDYDRKLGVHARKVPGNYRIEGSYNRELPAVFLREIAECKKFDFNTEPRY